MNRTIDASNRLDERPINKNMEGGDGDQKRYPMRYFKGQDLELQYMEKQPKPGVDNEIKEGFFEIKKKFRGDRQQMETQEV